MKTYCPIHCFNYSGHTCPYCEQDRINALARKHNKKDNNVQKALNEERKSSTKIESTEVTSEMLDALASKFNSMRKK